MIFLMKAGRMAKWTLKMNSVKHIVQAIYPIRRQGILRLIKQLIAGKFQATNCCELSINVTMNPGKVAQLPRFALYLKQEIFFVKWLQLQADQPVDQCIDMQS